MNKESVLDERGPFCTKKKSGLVLSGQRYSDILIYHESFVNTAQ
jgi:hypothetical protein